MPHCPAAHRVGQWPWERWLELPMSQGEAWTGSDTPWPSLSPSPRTCEEHYCYFSFAGEETEGVPGTGADTPAPGVAEGTGTKVIPRQGAGAARLAHRQDRKVGPGLAGDPASRPGVGTRTRAQLPTLLLSKGDDQALPEAARALGGQREESQGCCLSHSHSLPFPLCSRRGKAPRAWASLLGPREKG